MRTRVIVATVLAIAALPLLAFGLIDPLEGGLALIVAIALAVAVRLLSRVTFPRLAWISMLVSVAIGVTTIIVAVTGEPVETAPGTVLSPMSGWAIVLLWAYRLAVLVTLAGAVLYVVQLFQALKASTPPVADHA